VSRPWLALTGRGGRGLTGGVVHTRSAASSLHCLPSEPPTLAILREMSDAKPSRGKRGGRGAGPNGCSDGAADATTAPKRVSGKRGAGKKEAVTSPGRGKKAKKGIEEGLTGLVYSDSVQAMEGWVQESGGGDGHGPETLDGDAPFMDTVVKVAPPNPNFSDGCAS
jgi:hypothetical protein